MIDRDKIIRLFDIYNSFLTEKQVIYFKNYYFEDLSLNEIAENYSVSKALVGKTIKTAEDKLLEYESKLELTKMYDKINNIIEIEKDEKIKETLKEIAK